MEHRYAERRALPLEAILNSVSLKGRYSIRDISAEGLSIDAASEAFATNRIVSVMVRDPVSGACSPPIDMFVVHRNGNRAGLMSMDEQSDLGEFIRSISSAAAQRPLPGPGTRNDFKAIRTQEKAA
jgi:hypothetical protein